MAKRTSSQFLDLLTNYSSLWISEPDNGSSAGNTFEGGGPVSAPGSSLEFLGLVGSDGFPSGSGSLPGRESGVSNPITPTPATGDQYFDGLLTNDRWSSTSIQYSFPATTAVYDYGVGTYQTGFNALTAQQETAADFALDLGGPAGTDGFSVQGFTDLNVVYDASPDTSSTAKEEIRLANTTWVGVNTAEVADFPSNYFTTDLDDNGDVWFGTYNSNIYRTPTAGNFAWHTHIHEIGHALGLKHGHEDSVYGPLPADRDSMEYTIMTYRSYIDDPLSGGYSNETWGYAQTWMMLDIQALQHMYGADFTTNSGDTVYSWSPSNGHTNVDGNIAIDPGGNRIFATIWDGGGNDTYDLSAYSTDLDIDLRPGEHSLFSTTQQANLGDGNFARGNIFNALLYQGNTASRIENAIGGSGNDDIRGNQAANEITGGAGNDSMVGDSGNDDFIYDDASAVGNDTISGGTGTDEIIIAGSGTFDMSSADFQISGIETLEFKEAGAGSTVRINAQETDSAAELDDVLIDGWNNVGTGSERVEVVAGPVSTVDLSAWTFSGWNPQYGDRIAIIGDSTSENITGTSQWDEIEGGGGTDVINGGAGNDTLNGGAGQDQVNGDAGDDLIVYDFSEGYDNVNGGTGIDTYRNDYFTDRVYDLVSEIFTATNTASTWDLIAIENIESNGTGNDSIIGNALDNMLGGGAGDDTIEGGNGNDTIDGGDDDDEITPGGGMDQTDAGAGNDTIFDTLGVAPTSNDTHDGGAGIDTLNADASWVSTIHFDLGTGFTYSSGATRDRLISIENLVVGGAAQMTGNAGANHLTANGIGANLIAAGDGADTVDAGGGNDSVEGEDGNDELNGGDDDDRLEGGNGMDTLNGGSGMDSLFGDLDDDTIDGGGGYDTVYYTGLFAGVFVTLESGIATGGGGNDMLMNVENAYGSGYDDVIYGTQIHGNRIDGSLGNDALFGLAGNDTLLGGDGQDRLVGGANADSLLGGNQSDTLEGNDGNDKLNGGNDGDRLEGGDGLDTLLGFSGEDSLFGGLGDDEINGGSGFDTVYYTGLASGIFLTLESGLATGGGGSDTLFAVEHAYGSGYADTIYGTNAHGNRLEGSSGDDTLYGLDGNDTLVGGDGQDRLIGGDNADSLLGGNQSDTLEGNDGNDRLDGGAQGDRLEGGDGMDTLLGVSGEDSLFGGLGNDDINGGSGYDTVYYTGLGAGISLTLESGLASGGGGNDVLSNVEHAYGSGHADTIYGTIVHGNRLEGSLGEDTIYGLDGNDTILGGADDDRLLGGADTDFLFGQSGADFIDGGPGRDLLTGGPGGDNFVFRDIGDLGIGAFLRDEIRDFDASEGDVVNLYLIDANANTPGDNSFTVVASFTGTAGELTLTDVVRSGVDVTVANLDVTGDGVTDGQIYIVGGANEVDFIL